MKKIAIFGVPRSGTSWLAQIFNSHPDVVLRYQPLFSYGHKGALTEQSSAAEIRDFFDAIQHSQDALATMRAEFQKSYPMFQKSESPSHIVFKETRYLNVMENMLSQCDDIKVIGIVRNPLAVLASWVRAPKEFKPEWDIHAEWRSAPGKNQGRAEEYFGFERWKESSCSFLRFQERFPHQFRLVRYDELNKNPFRETADLFEFCGLAMGGQVERFLQESKSRHDPDPYSVFRASADDKAWRDVLPAEIVEQVREEVKDGKLETFLEETEHA